MKRAPASKRKLTRREIEEAAERDEIRRNRVWGKLYDAGKQQAAHAIMTMEELIVALGGPHEIAQWLYPGEYERWLKNGHVARGYDLQVYLTLTTMGYRHINPRLFGVRSWSELLLPPMLRLPELEAACQRP